ncbi:MAG: TonB-dependent receptor, partial [Acidimicrobiia bacterium]
NRASFYNAFDTNRDGVITQAELGAALTFTNTAGNPNGKINYNRTFQSQDGPQDTASEGLSFYVQDTFSFGRLTINAGLRTERWEHVATTGENIFTFDWELAPRLSVVYDIKGDGRQKAFGYYGRYYDPIRNNLTNFAGTLTGAIRNEQVFANGEWVTYRVRGGPVVQDAFFAPTTQTPYTDDIEVGYEVDLGHNMSAEVTYANRRTRDIIEDYDLALYSIATNGSTLYPGPINHPQSLFLPLSYFGYDRNPGSNFVIATLAGGKRDYQGIELIVRKRFANNWQGLASYTFNDVEGNTNSDSNADFQGDDIFLDPRGPNAYARQPGSIRHLFKLGGSYAWPMGLELGGGLRANSGTIASKTFLTFRRNLPIQVENGFEYAGFTEHWIAPDAIGSLTNPSWAQFDVRVKYSRRFQERWNTEFFVDIFNLFDNQDSIRDQDLVAGQGSLRFGDPIRYLEPRRFFLGARLSF